MNRFLLLFFFCLTTISFSQYSDVTIAEIEEHGIGMLDSKFQFDGGILDTNSWKPVTNAINPIGRPAYGVIGDYLFVFGGQNQSSQAVAFKITDETWTLSTPASAPGYNHASCVSHGELYKFSGTSSTSVFEKFTPNSNGTGTWTPLNAAPSALMNAQAYITSDDGNYIYAGSGDYANPSSAYFARYNITSGSWEMLPAPPYVKRYAGMAYLNGFVYIMGGLVPTGGDPTICMKYEVSTQTWTTIAPAPEAFNFTKWSVSTDGRYIWVIGSGGGYSTYPHSNNVYYYDPVTNTWHLETYIPEPRGLALGLYLTGHGKIFFGGGNMNNSGTNFQVNCWVGTGGSYIPVELTSFTASVVGKNVELNWSTATETNNRGFDVERSSDNINFVSAAFISGKGTTTQPHQYSFIDKNVSSGKYFYRLKQTDYDGSYSYSKTIEIDITLPPALFELTQNYPNPFNPETKISFAIPHRLFVELSVYDLLGNKVATLLSETMQTGTYSVPFNSSEYNLSSGIYIYRLTSSEFTASKVMMLIK